MKYGYIYVIVNKINNKKYVGQTRKTLQHRFNQHIRKAEIHTNRYLYDAMNHYGYNNFIIKELEKCKIENLNKREIYYIKKMNTLIPNGYNMTQGGDGGDTYSKRTKKQKEIYGKKLSKILKDKYYLKHKDLTKENVLLDIKNGLSCKEMAKKYKCSKKYISDRIIDWFNKRPKEMIKREVLYGKAKKDKNFNYKKITKEQFLSAIKKSKSLNELRKNLCVAGDTVYRKSYELFNKSLKEISNNKYSSYYKNINKNDFIKSIRSGLNIKELMKKYSCSNVLIMNYCKKFLNMNLMQYRVKIGLKSKRKGKSDYERKVSIYC